MTAFPIGSRNDGHHDARAARIFCLLICVGIGVCFVHSTIYLILGIANPALDYFSFRQTQTALTAYWAWQEGFKLSYLTPVLGYPWSVPLEFPLYQWIVALLRHANIPIEVGGRLVSYGFYLATILPVWSLFRSARLSHTSFLVFVLMFLSSPFYTFWSRTVLIETCALFFSACWLALLVRSLLQNSSANVAGAIICGTLAILTKSTTFPPFLLVGFMIVLLGAVRHWRQGSAIRYKTILTIGLIYFIPLAVGLMWVWFSNAVRIENPIGQILNNEFFAKWNFGSWDQRWSASLWDVITRRTLLETLGYGFPAALILFGVLLTSARLLTIGFLMLVGYISAFLIFTNVHIAHNYYQCANAIFLIVAIGIAAAHLAESGRRVLATLILFGIITGQVAYFRDYYRLQITNDWHQSHIYRIANLAKEHTDQREGLLIFGNDWSSAIPYYSERKSFAVPELTPAALLDKLFSNPDGFFGDLRIGAVVYCTDMSYGNRTAEVLHFISRRSVTAEVGSCKLLSPK